MRYTCHTIEGEPATFPVGKVVCVGRNYAEHARELNNPVPTEPLLFMKPATALAPFSDPVRLPEQRGSVHYETEIAILIGREISHISSENVITAIAGVGLALDLTLRELQGRLKEKGHPWEIAKGFDGACPLSSFVSTERVGQWDDIDFQLSIDGEIRQHGNSIEMLMPILPLISYISEHFTLCPGDVVLTGTPAGVGELASGMTLKAEINGLMAVESSVL
ncbi:fumarylacetoacetate hydrolase family protein [Kistimonas asteriae]|uniref:fumarylacetoacetate hydrolase family protein n=1 Tax=Kistimonas asteriae TaxID=517724 RepID=UPI001BA98F01|nr:fumarylacetoacetate hydrolase family protein [Kistimonas asteriae]